MKSSNSNDATDAELFATLGTPRSAVGSKAGKFGSIAIVATALAVGGITYAGLATNRAEPSNQAIVKTATPPTVVPATRVATQYVTPPAPYRVPEAEPESLPEARAEPVPLVRTSFDAPGLIFDLAVADPAPASAATAIQTPTVLPVSGTESDTATPKSGTPNERFVSRMNGVTLVSTYASRIHDTSLIATQGTVIPAVLETAINSDLPGYVRAVVSRDVRGFDGTRVLIPRGSKLIGQYKSGTSAGQSRAFVIWSRLITPAGVSVELSSPAIDETGKTGAKGETNTHFLTRFGSSILLSVIDAALNIGIAKSLSSNNSVVIATPQQATNAATVALQRNIDLPITISVLQGTPIRAFITQDLDFSGTMSAQP